MSYNSIYASVNDNALQGRVTAAVAAEGQTYPTNVMQQVIWPVCAHSDIEAAYASALAGDNPNPGGDESVITDQMILSAVQAELPGITP